MERLQNSMQFVIEQQVKLGEPRQSERTLHPGRETPGSDGAPGRADDEAADLRFKRSETRVEAGRNLDRLEENLTRLQGTLRDFVASLRAERRGNGRGAQRND
jgi:hypothetical protein